MMSVRLIRTAVVFFVVGVALGAYVSGERPVAWIAGGASAVSLGVLLLAVHVFAGLRAPVDLHYR